MSKLFSFGVFAYLFIVCLLCALMGYDYRLCAQNQKNTNINKKEK